MDQRRNDAKMTGIPKLQPLSVVCYNEKPRRSIAMHLNFRLSRQHSIRSLAASLILLAGITIARAETPSAGDAALFARLDANRDGAISADELTAEHKRLFSRLLRRADANGDDQLSRDEFLSGLTPSRPEKPIEAKQPATSPQADAVRYLLLTIDTNTNAVIEADEVPDDLQRVFAAMVDRLDRNDNGNLEPMELSRGGPPLAQLAGRYVASREIDVAVELKKLQKAQGRAAERFDGKRPPVEMLGDPEQARALFARLDANGDGHVQHDEVPEPFQPQLERFLRVADRNRDDRLSESEFLTGAERISRFLSRRQ
ncbi:MAG: EF-hand domain-containing protein [Pirellulales bacterium]